MSRLRIEWKVSDGDVDGYRMLAVRWMTDRQEGEQVRSLYEHDAVFPVVLTETDSQMVYGDLVGRRTT